MSEAKTCYFLSNATTPVAEGYAQVDVLLAAGKIAKIAPAGTLSAPTDATVVDCAKKMVGGPMHSLSAAFHSSRFNFWSEHYYAADINTSRTPI